MKTITELTKYEVEVVSGGGEAKNFIKDAILLNSLEVVKGLTFPVIGVFLTYGIIKLLSRRHVG